MLLRIFQRDIQKNESGYEHLSKENNFHPKKMSAQDQSLLK